MKTYQADEAIAKFRGCFDDAELDYELVDSGVDFVRVKVSRGSVSLVTWFDVNNQQWGFDLLQGGVKTCPSFEEFEDFFATYLSIHTVFIPNAKIVTDAFEHELGINTVFDSFSGNKQKGYTIKFKVLGAGDQSVLVQRVTEGYLVRLVVPDDVTQKYKVRYEYKYELSEDGVATPIPTMHMFMRRLKDRYDGDSNVQIQRMGDNIFSFSIEDLVISATVTFNYMEVRYHVTEVSCYDADLMITPEDPFSLSTVYMECKDFYNDCVASENEGEEPGVDEQETSCEGAIVPEDADALHQEEQDAVAATEAPFEDESDEADFEDFGGSESDEEDEEEYAEGSELPKESEIEDEEFDATVEEPDETVKIGSQEVQPVHKRPQLSGLIDPEEQDEMSVESIKLVIEDGETIGVQFIVDGQPYIFGVDKVKTAGLPVKRVKDKVQIIYKCGMRMTEDEKRLKRYADELDNPDEILGRIIDAVFA